MRCSVGRAKHDKVMITANEQDIFIGEVTVSIHATIIHNHRKNIRVFSNLITQLSMA